MPNSQNSQERDPNGIDQHSPGAKLDEGKPLAGLVLCNFARALETVVNVGTYGAKKYSPCGWLEVPNGIERYKDAMWRHILSSNYDAQDPQTGLLHLSHACWNNLAVLELMERNRFEVELGTQDFCKRTATS